MTNEMKMVIATAGPLVTQADEELITQIAFTIYTNHPDELDFDQALHSAAEAIRDYRQHVRETKAVALAEALPIRPAIPAPDDATARRYWRVRTDKHILPAVKDTEKNKGDYAGARRKARELMVAGVTVLELIPPDFDQPEDEWTENRSKMQPDGMTVRQRTKKH